MKPNIKWINDWHIGENPSKEKEISTELLEIFMDFWANEKLDEKSKTTKNRYGTSLHTIGGHIVEHAIVKDDSDKTAYELLSDNICDDEGPLIYPENQDWQNEVDMVCRRLYKYMKRKR
jgi:hypothetical protein